MNKIKEIIRKIESKKETFEKIALLKELDDEVSKFRKELINKQLKDKKMEIQSKVGRIKRRAIKRLDDVCKGQFP